VVLVFRMAAAPLETLIFFLRQKGRVFFSGGGGGVSSVDC